MPSHPEIKTPAPEAQAPAPPPPRPDPTRAEAQAAEKVRLSMAARIEQERRDDLEVVTSLHAQMLAKISLAADALAAASSVSEELQRELGKKRFYREVNLARRLRVSDVVRTVNAARQHVSRMRDGSKAVGKSVVESTDELVRANSEAVFE